MFIPEITELLSPFFSIVSTIFMIWMIVDCLRNPKLVHKVGWVFFIIFTQFIGAAVYFFARGPWPKVKQYLFPGRFSSSYYYSPGPQRTSAPLSTQDAFSPYEQGYRVQQSNVATASQETEEEEHVTSLQPEYEEPLIMYPEPPQA